MDTKLRSNGEPPEIREPDMAHSEEKGLFFEEGYYPEKTKKAGGIGSVVLLVTGIFLTCFCVFAAMDISSYEQSMGRRVGASKLHQIGWGNTQADYYASEEILRYAKNLQRFFIHYDSFDPDNINDIAAATSEEIKSLQMEREVIYQRASREIMESYNEKIRPIEDRLNEREFSGEASEGIYYETDIYTNDSNTVRFTMAAPSSITREEYNEYSRLIDERDSLIAELAKQYLLTDTQAAEIIAAARQEGSVYDASNYYEIKAYLENTDYLRYCLKDAREDGYITNIPEKDWERFENPMQYVERTTEYYASVQDDYFRTGFNGKPLNEWFKNAGLSGYVFIPATVSYGDNNPISEYLLEKTEVMRLYRNFTIFVVAACIIAIILWVLFLKSDKEYVVKAGRKLLRLYRKLPLTLKAGLLLVSAMLIFEQADAINGMCYGIYSNGLVYKASSAMLSLAASTASIIYMLVCVRHLWDVIKKPSIILEEPEIKIIGRLFGNLALIFRQNMTSISLSMLFLIISYMIVQLALFIIAFGSGYMDSLAFVIFEVIINILALYVFGLITALAKINKYMDAIISGDLEAEINEKGGYKAVINKLNRVRGGVKRVVVEKNKSDKMKTDLITNVSHDLKTPLTSIINYIELLKSPQATDANRAEYIEILEKKAQRVKLLIDDLFEATKLSSGQIMLDRRKLNIVSLLKQAVGELEDKFITAGIMLKLVYADEIIYVDADGKKLWRVFENLFTNIIKYSQPGTRAYVDVSKSGGYAELVFKNISFYEMNFQYDELFERGRRGDVSRSTEGSGLGLSIAKDIVELHGGTMEIAIDGDLFKVTAVLPETGMP